MMKNRKKDIWGAVSNVLLCLLCLVSCDSVDNIVEGTNAPTSITVTKDWGLNIADVKSRQDKQLTLIQSTANTLRYADAQKEIIIDYSFDENKLKSSSLTQKGVLNTNDITKKWLKGYDQLAKSENALIYISKQSATLAYGKIINGSEDKYASIAWTAIDENEAVSDGYDFTPSGVENGVEYVDLGIGIGWALQNIGASSPSKAGGYYMWGETSTKNSCWWWYYSLYRGSTDTYLDPSKFYTPYSNISGTNYDVAKVMLGGRWRMPTRAELSTLMNNCEFKVGTYDDVIGFVVTGPSGKSIFLPAAGQKEKEEVKSTNLIVCLWSSTKYTSDYAYYLKAYIKRDEVEITSGGKYYGIPVRGVFTLE